MSSGFFFLLNWRQLSDDMLGCLQVPAGGWRGGPLQIKGGQDEPLELLVKDYGHAVGTKFCRESLVVRKAIFLSPL